jgi:hypothetical protein
MPSAKKSLPENRFAKPSPTKKRADSAILDFFIAFFVPYFVYLLTTYPTVGTEDSGELITSAATLDIAHPSGYPLHTLLGHLFTRIIPFGNIGWRVNIMSAFFGAITIAILFLILKKLTSSSRISLFFSLFFAFSNIFWSQSIRTEVYTLDIFLLTSIIYLLLRWDETEKAKYIYLTALCFGLGVSNHHMILLAAPPAFIFILIRNYKIFIQPKIIGISALMLALGLSFYLYLPIRTALGPYNNPAYIQHEKLYIWENFFNFVNRSIYGGTISLSQSNTQNSQDQPSLPEKIGTTIIKYADQFITNNLNGFTLMLKNTFKDLLMLPLILVIPGIWFLVKKRGRFTIFLFLLFLFYTSVQLIFIKVTNNMHPLTAFSNRPFYLSAILILAVFCGTGLRFLINSLNNRAVKATLTALMTFLPLTTLAANFYNNNESHNYIARDFSFNLLQSIPKNGYLLSTGKDNLTFPLYYLRQVEKIRPDINLEIYYGRDCPNRLTLEEKLSSKNLKHMFIDLLPCGFNDLDLTPYNFVYAYGDTSSLPPSSQKYFRLRGMRKKMDYPNNKLKGLYLLKMAILNEKDPPTAEYYFNKVKKEIDNVPQLQEFMWDLRAGLDKTGMF